MSFLTFTFVSTEAELVVTDELLSHNLFQLNNVANSHGNVLDTAFSTRYDDVSTTCPANPLCNGIGSDAFHRSLVIEMSFSTPPSVERTILATRNFKRANYTAINNALGAVNWDEVLCGLTIDENVDKFYNVVNDKISEHVPLSKQHYAHSRPWMTQRLIRLRTRKRNLVRRVEAFNKLNDTQLLNSISLQFSSLNKYEYDRYIRSTGEKLKHDPKRFWSFVDERHNRKDLPSSMSFGQMHNASDSAKLFADYFGSVFTEPTESATLDDFVPNSRITESLSGTVTEDEVRKLILKLDGGKDQTESHLAS